MECSFVSGMPSGRTNNYPESGRGLGHVTPTIFGIRSNISLKVLELETSNLIHGFVWVMPSRRINNFPESRRGLGRMTLTILAVRSAILATAWLLVSICDNVTTRKMGREEREGITKFQDVIMSAICGWTPLCRFQ